MFENSSMESFENLERSYEDAPEFGFQSDTDYGTDLTSPAFDDTLKSMFEVVSNVEHSLNKMSQDSFKANNLLEIDGMSELELEHSLDSIPSDTSYGTDLTPPAFESNFPYRDSEMKEPAEKQPPQDGGVLQCCDSNEIDPIDQLSLDDDLGSPLSDLDPEQESFERHGVMHLNRSNRLTWPFKMNPRKASFDRFLEHSNGSNFDLKLVE